MVLHYLQCPNAGIVVGYFFGLSLDLIIQTPLSDAE